MGEFNPAGKTFKQRLAAFLSYVEKNYGVHIRQDQGRTPQWAQKMHICHMFLYNTFAHNKPRPGNVDPVNKRTIAWEHLSDPKVEWSLVNYSELLRTSDGGIPEKVGPSWKPGKAPDLAQTTEHMTKVLLLAGCAHGGKAMIACGIKPCGEPCRCSTGTSKHLDGLAADLKMADLNLLSNKLKTNKAGSLDDLLYKFGLHRPMLHHKTSPEEWHVEAVSSDSINHSYPPAHHHKRHRQLEFRDQLIPSSLKSSYYT